MLVELNEVTWDLIDPLIEQGKLPTFARLKREGAWAAPVSVDAPPHLDPWITWTTVYTGRAQEDHNVDAIARSGEDERARTERGFRRVTIVSLWLIFGGVVHVAGDALKQ